MLLWFKIKNFKSYADEVVFDMQAAKIKEHEDSLIVRNNVNVKVLPVAAIYGANASGKSNFFEAYNLMSDIVIRSAAKDFNRKSSEKITQYIFEKAYSSKNTVFEICIVAGDDNEKLNEYVYGFEFNEKAIIEEWLLCRKFSKNVTVQKTLFRVKNSKLIKTDANEKLKKNINYCLNVISSNELKETLLLSLLGSINAPVFSSVYSWFNNYSLCKWLSNIEFLHSIRKNNKKGEGISIDIQKACDLISEVDPSITRIDTEEKVNSQGARTYKMFTYHLVNGKEEKFDLDIESLGTQTFIELIFPLVFNLFFGTTVFIDELDRSLHPLLLRRIIQLYTDPTTNPKGAQLIFSSHNIICLDRKDLRRDEIWFVEKKDQKSSMFSLYDFDDDGDRIRNDVDFSKHYLAGRFGAVPFNDSCR